MRIAFRSGAAEHIHEHGSADGPILAVVAKALPREVAAIAHNGTPRHPCTTTRDELLSAIRAVLSRLEADPGLLFAYACSVEALGDEPPVGRQFGRGGGVSGIRFPDTPAGRAYALVCGPGRCDLDEMAIGPDGRGMVVGTVDVRGETELRTANLGRIRIYRRPANTQLRQELERLRVAVEGWPPDKVAKFVRLRD